MGASNPTPDPFYSFFKNIFANGGKSVEKLLLYASGILASTNVFGTTAEGSNVRIWLTASIALVLAGLHVSTPTPKSGPNQL